MERKRGGERERERESWGRKGSLSFSLSRVVFPVFYFLIFNFKFEFFAFFHLCVRDNKQQLDSRQLRLRI